MAGWPAVAAISALAVAAAAMLYVIDPARSAVYPPCLFHALTGLHCPGCGSLRALHKALHGEVRAAFGLNALLVLFLPFGAYSAMAELARVTSRRRLPALSVPPAGGVTILVVILGFWVLRNVPVYPLTLLAP